MREWMDRREEEDAEERRWQQQQERFGVLVRGLTDEYERVDRDRRRLRQENLRLRGVGESSDGRPERWISTNSDSELAVAPQWHMVSKSPLPTVARVPNSMLEPPDVGFVGGVMETPACCRATQHTTTTTCTEGGVRISHFEAAPSKGSLAVMPVSTWRSIDSVIDQVRSAGPRKRRQSFFTTRTSGRMDEELLSSTREEKVSTLRRHFDRLTKDGEETFSLSCLDKMLVQTQGNSVHLTMQRLREVVEQLEKLHTYHFREGRSRTEEDEAFESVDQDELTFTAFSDIILFDLAAYMDDRLRRDVLHIRDALMKTLVIDLVAHYSHIKREDQVHDRHDPWFKLAMDAFVGTIIVINSITIGISSDVKSQAWEILELIFTVIFVAEIVFKFWYFGCRDYFCGKDWSWNIFEAIVVALAGMDVAVSFMASGHGLDLQDLLVVRFARLARLTRMLRLLRVLRLRIFKELLLMVKGVVAGLRTLFWAIVMLLFIVYACGIMLRQTVGEDNIKVDDEYNTVLFGSIAWSMFNVFRCFLSDCTLANGTPIAAHVYESYGVMFVIPYSLCMMFITFGIFNMVTAVFVENVMESARQKQLLSKDTERRRVAGLVARLVIKVASTPLDAYDAEMSSKNGITRMTRWYVATGILGDCSQRQIQGDVTRDMFRKSLEDPEVVGLIEDLDVRVGDPSDLFDALDADGNNSIDIGELISGVMKMRSGETKNDVVAIILAMRGIRTQLHEIYEALGLHYRDDEELEVIRNSTAS